MTVSGEARSGKGRSVAALSQRLSETGTPNRVIDQGLKFRALAEVAMTAGQPLEDGTALTHFMRSPNTQKSMLGLLDTVRVLSEADKKDLLYNSAVGAASSQIASVSASHEIAVGLLRQEVAQAVEEDQKVVLIDGRAVEKYGMQFEEERLAVFALGWYFRCDSSVAAHRSLGLSGQQDLTAEQILQVHTETAEIRNRNFRDQTRGVDPLREPARAYRIDLRRYYDTDYGAEVGSPYIRGHDAMQVRMAMVDTTYTTSVEEMLGPVVEVPMMALLHKGAVTHDAVGVQFASPGEW